MNKRSVLLLIALIIGVIYLCMQIGNITSHANTVSTSDPQTAEQAGEAIGTAITKLARHIIERVTFEECTALTARPLTIAIIGSTSFANHIVLCLDYRFQCLAECRLVRVCPHVKQVA
jgi:hypothetical protein